MHIELNGEKVTTQSGTLLALLEEQKIETKGVAVAINRRVVPRTKWGEYQVVEGDQVVIVSAVYGG